MKDKLPLFLRRGPAVRHANRLFTKVVVCLICMIISDASCSSVSIYSIVPFGQAGIIQLYKTSSGAPVAEYSIRDRTFFFDEDGTLLNTRESARAISLQAEVEREFVRSHNLVAIQPIFNFVRYAGDNSTIKAVSPATELISAPRCDWPFQMAILFKNELGATVVYSFVVAQSASQEIEMTCEDTGARDLIKTRLRPAPVSIYVDPSSKDTLFVLSDLTPCIRRFTLRGRLTHTCKNDPLEVIDGTFLEDVFTRFTSGAVSAPTSIRLIESKVKPITSLQRLSPNP